MGKIIKDYDAVVIGAGLAGNSCAKHLSNNGLNVMIIEKNKLPVEKCCYGLYDKQAINFIKNNFGDIPEDLFYKNKIIKVKLLKFGKSFIDVPDTEYLNLYREKIDHWLLEKSGAKYYDNISLPKIQNEKNKIIFSGIRNNKEIQIKCKYLIGCDGLLSKTREIVDPDYSFSNSTMGTIKQCKYTGNIDIDENFFYISNNKKFTNNGTASLIKNDNQIIITTELKSGKKYYENWFNFLKEIFSTNLKFVKQKIGFIKCLFSKDEIFYGNGKILLAGEAAGLSAANIEGYFLALLSGRLAAEAVLNNNGDNLIKTYKNLLKDIINKLYYKNKH